MNIQIFGNSVRTHTTQTLKLHSKISNWWAHFPWFRIRTCARTTYMYWNIYALLWKNQNTWKWHFVNWRSGTTVVAIFVLFCFVYTNEIICPPHHTTPYHTWTLKTTRALCFAFEPAAITVSNIYTCTKCWLLAVRFEIHLVVGFVCLFVGHMYFCFQ